MNIKLCDRCGVQDVYYELRQTRFDHERFTRDEFSILYYGKEFCVSCAKDFAKWFNELEEQKKARTSKIE